MAKNEIPAAPSIGSLLGKQSVNKQWFLENSALVMASLANDSSPDEMARGANLLASAAALGVNVQKIFAWADGVYKRAEIHYKKEAALYERTKELSRRVDMRYGKRPMFSLRKAKLQTIAEAIQIRLNKKSKERAIAAYVMGVAYVRMGALHNAVRVGFERACKHEEVSAWIKKTAEELHQTGADAFLQVTMASGLFQNSKIGHEDETAAKRLINGHERLLTSRSCSASCPVL